jgi:chemotaxis protein methyltransferase CheR
MHSEDFTFLARLVRRRSGVSLPADKMEWAARRLEPVMRRFDFRDPAGLMAELRLGRAALAEAVTEAMTVNDTSFFRDADLFARFRDRVLPRLLMARSGERRLRIWSAACASGQEAWSIAILLAELGLARNGWNIDLIATDLSGEAIARAEAGRYAPVEIERGLDGHALRWLRRDGGDWVVDDALRRMVSFRRFNLLDSFGWLDDLDIVFCRNVLIYFEPGIRADIFARLGETLAADGALLLGQTETAQAPFALGQDGPDIYVKARPALLRGLDQRLSA